MKFAIYKTSRLALKKAGASVIQKKWRISGGFTLIELVVYMAIMGFIIIVAGRVFSDSTKMRVRSQNMVASTEEAGRVSALIKEDVSQMGAKSWKNQNGTFKVAKKVCYEDCSNPLTAESYNKNKDLTKGIEFRKVHYKNDGTCRAVLKITWELDAAKKELTRKCEPITTDQDCPNNLGTDKEAECPTLLVMATGVTELKFEPSKYEKTEPLFPPTTNPPTSGFGFIVKNGSSTESPLSTSGAPISLRGFPPNTSNGTNHKDFYLATTNNTGSCWLYPFVAGEKYTIGFDLPCEKSACRDGNELYNPMTMFQPGKDHLSVGLRSTSMNGAPISGVPDFLFYPPQDVKADETKTRHFEFSVPANTNACIGITAAFYSSEEIAQKGHLEIENFKVSKISTNTTSPADVKAFKLTLQIKKGIKDKEEVSEAVTVIPVPNNGVMGGT
ncbi:MAG: prepilin-type N-terminal cleavage/methylation domain-containing protein [Fibromonadaceae bacterium]|jgi:type II secretory pathway pseudopilin PulG|nr:prepilin-type N-terminal cleavage/methylation domain-containing protein [Fibromonadaceae bacterium]